MNPYDLSALFSHRELLNGLDPADSPRLVTLEDCGSCRSVAVLPGSFNPPTGAHLLLAERALREGFDCVLLVLARTTVGKNGGGLIPEDRFMALRGASRATGLIPAVSSAGLYCDQAEAVARVFPRADIAFLVGSDKIVQIFEDRWYEDREESLRRFFQAARLLVSPRADQNDRVAATLAEKRNAPYASSVSLLPLHPAVGDLSSTRVRGLLQSGADASGLVPTPVGAFLAETRAFAPPLNIDGDEVDAYRLRARLVDILWDVREWAERAADFRELMSLALSPTPEGRRLRTAAGSASDSQEIMRFAEPAASGEGH
jgi:nicotinamide-nucleotide adenylyltransferase